RLPVNEGGTGGGERHAGGAPDAVGDAEAEARLQAAGQAPERDEETARNHGVQERVVDRSAQGQGTGRFGQYGAGQPEPAGAPVSRGHHAARPTRSSAIFWICCRDSRLKRAVPRASLSQMPSARRRAAVSSGLVPSSSQPASRSSQTARSSSRSLT